MKNYLLILIVLSISNFAYGASCRVLLGSIVHDLENDFITFSTTTGQKFGHQLRGKSINEVFQTFIYDFPGEKHIQYMYKQLKGKRVLDIGTGRGQFVKDLRLLGIDAIGTELVLTSKSHYLLKDDILNSHLPLNSFDYIISTSGIFTYAQYEKDIIIKAFQNISRIIKKDGIVAIGPIDYKMYKEYQKDIERLGFKFKRRKSKKSFGHLFLKKI